MNAWSACFVEMNYKFTNSSNYSQFTWQPHLENILNKFSNHLFAKKKVNSGNADGKTWKIIMKRAFPRHNLCKSEMYINFHFIDIHWTEIFDGKNQMKCANIERIFHIEIFSIWQQFLAFCGWNSCNIIRNSRNIVIFLSAIFKNSFYMNVLIVIW